MIRSCLVTISCLLLFILSSCGENEAGGINVQTSNPAPQLPSASRNASPVVGTGAPIIPGGRLNPAHGQPGHRCDIAVGAPLPAGISPALQSTPVGAGNPQNILPASQPVAPTIATPAVANGLNPAHGQPGHRCDIPVGQPLSTPVAAKPSVTTTVTPANTAPDTMFAKGLNPAHGKPGHRCDIAVGQPLNTPAKKDTAASSGSN